MGEPVYAALETDESRPEGWPETRNCSGLISLLAGSGRSPLRCTSLWFALCCSTVPPPLLPPTRHPETAPPALNLLKSPPNLFKKSKTLNGRRLAGQRRHSKRCNHSTGIRHGPVLPRGGLAPLLLPLPRTRRCSRRLPSSVSLLGVSLGTPSSAWYRLL